MRGKMKVELVTGHGIQLCYRRHMQHPNQTEMTLERLRGFDTWSNVDILSELLSGQRRALDAVEAALPSISTAADQIAQRLASGGRQFYAGAGTSIRLAVQDGTELPATFGMDENKLAYLIAGGRAAMFVSLADAEDDDAAGREAAQICTAADALIAVAASGRTPYTVGAAREAKLRGTCVVCIVNNAGSTLAEVADVAIVLESGPEVISGSTRLGAGTAQKAALNLLSSLVHTKLGAVYDGLMVNVQAGNKKLHARAIGIVQHISGAPPDKAHAALRQADGKVKIAILLCAGASDVSAAEALLAESKGYLRVALTLLATAT
jgi:N-acetylmuramic acid 6-phosphate etherase